MPWQKKAEALDYKIIFITDHMFQSLLKYKKPTRKLKTRGLDSLS